MFSYTCKDGSVVPADAFRINGLNVIARGFLNLDARSQEVQEIIECRASLRKIHNNTYIYILRILYIWSYYIHNIYYLSIIYILIYTGNKPQYVSIDYLYMVDRGLRALDGGLRAPQLFALTRVDEAAGRRLHLHHHRR